MFSNNALVVCSYFFLRRVGGLSNLANLDVTAELETVCWVEPQGHHLFLKLANFIWDRKHLIHEGNNL